MSLKKKKTKKKTNNTIKHILNGARFSALPFVLFLLISLILQYKFVLWGQHYIAADFTDFYYPWRHSLVQESNRNTYIENKDLGDPLFIIAPTDIEYNRMLKKGKLFTWNPDVFMGHPTYAIHHTAFLYPPKMVFNYFFDWLTARELLSIFNLFIMGCFMYVYLLNLRLSRSASTLGGLVWTACLYSTTRLEFGTEIAPLIFLPPVLLSIDKILLEEKKAFLPLLSAAVCLMLISGHWQFALYGFLFSSIYFIFRLAQKIKTDKKFPFRDTLYLVMFGAAGITLSAPHTLPALELIKHSHREALQNWSQAFNMARLFPENLLTLFIPELLGNPTENFYVSRFAGPVQKYWELAIYAGIIPLVLAVYSIFCRANRAESRFYGISAIVVILMAMGTPLYWILFTLVPPLRSLSPARILCLFSFCIAVLSAFGVQGLFDEKEKSGQLPAAFAGVSVFIALIIGIVIYNVRNETAGFAGIITNLWKSGVMELPNNFADRRLFVYEMLLNIKRHYSWYNFSLVFPVFTAAAGAVLLWMNKTKKIKKTVLAAGILGLVFIELFVPANKYNPAFPENSIFPPAAAFKHMKENAREDEIYRVLGWKRYAHPNLLSAYGFQQASGYHSQFYERTGKFFEALNGEPSPSQLLAVLQKGENYNNGIARLLNIKYNYSRPGSDKPPIECERVYDKDLAVFELPENRRAFVVHNHLALNPDEILKLMMLPGFDPREAVLLEKEPVNHQEDSMKEISDESNPAGEDPEDELVEITEYENDRVVIKTNLTEPGILVLSDSWYPGWKAYVNGDESEILRAYYFLRSVPVNAGESTIEFRFEPDSFKRGKLVSLIALLVIILASIVHLPQKPAFVQT